MIRNIIGRRRPHLARCFSFAVDRSLCFHTLLSLLASYAIELLHPLLLTTYCLSMKHLSSILVTLLLGPISFEICRLYTSTSIIYFDVLRYTWLYFEILRDLLFDLSLLLGSLYHFKVPYVRFGYLLLQYFG